MIHDKLSDNQVDLCFYLFFFFLSAQTDFKPCVEVVRDLLSKGILMQHSFTLGQAWAEMSVGELS